MSRDPAGAVILSAFQRTECFCRTRIFHPCSGARPLYSWRARPRLKRFRGKLGGDCERKGDLLRTARLHFERDGRNGVPTQSRHLDGAPGDSAHQRRADPGAFAGRAAPRRHGRLQLYRPESARRQFCITSTSERWRHSARPSRRPSRVSDYPVLLLQSALNRFAAPLQWISHTRD